jgi:hypothetical protein
MPNPFERLRDKVVFSQSVKVVGRAVVQENPAERQERKTPEQRQVDKCARRAAVGGAYGVGFDRCRIDSYSQKLVMCQVHQLEHDHAARSVNSFLRCNGDQQDVIENPGGRNANWEGLEPGGPAHGVGIWRIP